MNILAGSSKELSCASLFMERGFQVSFPFGNGSRYDFIVDAYGSLYRFQCKSSRRMKSGAYMIQTSSSHLVCGKKKVKIQTYTKAQIDFFCTIIESSCYIIPVEFCEGRKHVSLAVHKCERFMRINAESCLIDNVFRKCGLVMPVENERVKREKKHRIVRTIDASDEQLKSEFSVYSIYEIARKHNCSRALVVKDLKRRGIYDELRAVHNLNTIHRESKGGLKRVVQCGRDGNVIREYDCASQTEEFGFKRNVVHMCCSGYKKSYKGFLWHYK